MGQQLIQRQYQLRVNWQSKKTLLFISLLFALFLFVLTGQKAFADTYYPGETPGISAPTAVNSSLSAACTSSTGQHTYHATWPSPYTIDPPYGATSYTIQLRGRSYVCPQVGYNNVTNITYSNITTNVTWATVNAPNSMGLGNAVKGGYSGLGNIGMTINLVGLSPGCNNFRVNYTISALHDGFPDSNTGYSDPVTVCYNTAPNPFVINAFSANCDTATVTATTQANHQYDARLLVDSTADGIRNPSDTTLLSPQSPLAGIASGGSYTFSTIIWKDFGARDFYVRVRDRTTSDFRETQLPRRVGPCLEFRCGRVTTPDIISPGDNFTATATFNVVKTGTTTLASMGSNGTPYNYYIRLSMLPDLYLEAQVGAVGTVTSSSGTEVTRTTGNITAPATLVSYITTSYIKNLAIGPNLASCNGAANGSPPTVVSNQPFFTARKGDVGVGIPLAPVVCDGWGSGSATSSLKSWNSYDTPVFGTGDPSRGAGSDLGVIARPNVIGFASAQLRITAPLPRIGLSFMPIVFGNFGGGSGSGIPCPTDYYATKPENTSPVIGSPFVPGSYYNKNDAFFSSDPLTLSSNPLSPSVALGYRPIIYVDNDVYISGDIKLASGAMTVDKIPNFYLIVKGNIYIAPSVIRLDGVYVAQPLDNGTKGKIYTCAYPSGATYRAPTQVEINDSTSGCRFRRLDVNGAFIAKELKLYRSINTLSTNIPSEQFNATPATWLATPCAISGNCTGGGDPSYDAITSLPPIL